MIEHLIAQTILQGADAMYGRFLDITRDAQKRFEERDWKNVQQAMIARINCYEFHVNMVSLQLKVMLNKQHATRSFLKEVKKIYCDLLQNYDRFDIAESFFNSVYCRIFNHKNIRHDKLFVSSAQNQYSPQTPVNMLRHYGKNQTLKQSIEGILNNTPFTLDWSNKDSDIKKIANALVKQFGKRIKNNINITMVNAPFFRNKAAYLIGKINLDNQIIPLLLPVLINQKQQLYVDACITDPDSTSVIFGFARSYFMVDAPVPHALVLFLKKMMPQKNLSQLYTAIGCQKHGKTELYREFLAHLSQSNDLFESAAGIKGMVMTVFTLPSYGYVFKIIKDKFSPQKNTTENIVKEKYRLVKEHDRIGRMADTQEYHHFIFPRDRFSESLINELLELAPSKIKLTKKEVRIKHLYMERRMEPLNLFLQQANDKELEITIKEYGDAIKQLAAANIFAGDMLAKNFGVSRHLKVIFYDYDEIDYLTNINFRHIPPPRYPEDEFSSTPWYSINENDVFPEEFRIFLLSNQKLRSIFEKYHADIFEVSFWKDLQNTLKKGVFKNVFPYQEKYRFK